MIVLLLAGVPAWFVIGAPIVLAAVLVVLQFVLIYWSLRAHGREFEREQSLADMKHVTPKNSDLPVGK
ncbi:MAG: hypothetical protein ABJX32_20435 [Tateyamaria sp.]|uniref:hypothetical protein n=1 Tax=Tateyamaria sp. TaxID=1929288 RepID=UPI0032A0169C